MERFKISCELAGNQVELQLDQKKIPGEAGPCYMVSVDGIFKGYLKKSKDSKFSEILNLDFDGDILLVINNIL